MDRVVLSNPKLILPKQTVPLVTPLLDKTETVKINPNFDRKLPVSTYYFNVNIPQTIHTWQRLYDINLISLAADGNIENSLIIDGNDGSQSIIDGNK